MYSSVCVPYIWIYSPLPSSTGDLPDAPSPLPLSPLSPPPSAESGAGVRRRHTRVRSVTSRAEMMSRPSSARARVEVQQPQDHPSSPLPTSPTPSQHSYTSRDVQVMLTRQCCVTMAMTNLYPVYWYMLMSIPSFELMCS